MKKQLLVIAFAAAVFTRAEAKTEHIYDRGMLAEMSSVSCGYEEKSAKGFAGVLLGTDSAHKNMRESLCQEYVLKSDRVIYRIRPRTEKKMELLPVGERAQFRIKKDRMMVVLPESEKEREFTVVSMTPVDRVESAAK
jgi:hypothetical protein